MDLKDLRKLFRAATGGRHGGKDEYRHYGGGKPWKRKHRGWHPHRTDAGTGYGYGPPHGYGHPTPPHAGGYGRPPPRSLKEALLAAALEWFRNRGRS